MPRLSDDDEEKCEIYHEKQRIGTNSWRLYSSVTHKHFMKKNT